MKIFAHTQKARGIIEGACGEMNICRERKHVPLKNRRLKMIRIGLETLA
jgi:hypothetical protein